MLFLPAAALCCLCSALTAMAIQLIQDDLTLTRRVGGKVYFSCRGTEQCDGNYVYWYQNRDTETFTVIVDIDKSNGNIDKKYNHHQKDDFSAVYKSSWNLQIQTVKPDHSATYYCACRRLIEADGEYRRYWIFGSGTKLIVSDEPVVKPVVSVYPAASRAHLEGKSALLCLASAMFPPLVQFSWKRRKENGPLEDLPPAEGEQLEIRELGRTTAILLIHQQKHSKYKYRCYIQHEGGPVEAQTEQEVSILPPSPPSHLPSASVPSQYQVKLFCLMYTELIVKSLVYCCGLSLLMILRNKGPSTN